MAGAISWWDDNTATTGTELWTWLTDRSLLLPFIRSCVVFLWVVSLHRQWCVTLLSFFVCLLLLTGDVGIQLFRPRAKTRPIFVPPVVQFFLMCQLVVLVKVENQALPFFFALLTLHAKVAFCWLCGEVIRFFRAGDWTPILHGDAMYTRSCSWWWRCIIIARICSKRWLKRKKGERLVWLISSLISLV